jgi:hypothetical protein
MREEEAKGSETSTKHTSTWKSLMLLHFGGDFSCFSSCYSLSSQVCLSFLLNAFCGKAFDQNDDKAKR